MGLLVGYFWATAFFKGVVPLESAKRIQKIEKYLSNECIIILEIIDMIDKRLCIGILDIARYDYKKDYIQFNEVNNMAAKKKKKK